MSSGKIEPSRTLKEMGLSKKIFNSAVRVSLGPYNNFLQASRFLLKQLITSKKDS